MGLVTGGPIDRGTFDRFRDSIEPGWVEEALNVTGTATIRRRRFPAANVLWLVLGMALFRNLSIVDLVEHLQLVLPGGKKKIAPSAVAQRRAKLGPKPLRWLFEFTANKWAIDSAGASKWRGLDVFGLDGTTIRVPDSPENRAHFGGHSAGSKRGQSGYPLVRLVTLMALRSHLLLAARFGPFRTSERHHARDLIPLVPDNSLLIADRNFAYARDLIPLEANGQNRHWLTRARKNHKWRVVKRLGRGDELGEIKVNSQSRRQVPSLPEGWRIRVIRYQRKGFPEQRLLTSLLDPIEYPASEIRQLYHERWEIELGFDEAKTEMLERQESIRSKSPDGVEQELWGLALAYNLVRLEMEKAAELAGVPPVRMSFKSCFMMIRTQMLIFGAMKPGRLPKVVAQLAEDLSHFVLPERRSQRRYPRAVKIKMSNYPRKRPPKQGGRPVK
jgi:hypothetical protein